jgi:hypothetical protein
MRFSPLQTRSRACNLLADGGIGIGVRSIGGRVWRDRVRFGELLTTVISLRRQLAVISFGVCLPVAAWMLWRNGSNLLVGSGLCVAIAASVIPLLGITAWATSAQLHAEYRRIQKLELGVAGLRLGLIGVLGALWMNSLLATLVGSLGNCVQAFFLRHWAREKIVAAAPINIDDRRELLRLAKAWMPNVIFFCLQGQVTLLILTVAGNTSGIADITALGRLGALFAIFSATFCTLLGPRFARCEEARRLPSLYTLLIVGSALSLFPFAVLAWLYPDLFLWLLGGNYASLESECGWVVAAACLSQVGGIMWNLNSNKAWIRFQSVGFIPTILGAQIIAALLLDLRQFHDVVIFNFVTAVAPLPLYVFDGLFGLRRALSPSTVSSHVDRF